MINYVGKALVIEEMKRKILVISDLHLGRGGIGEAGEIISKEIYKRTITDLSEILDNVGYIDEIVILGDLKQSFSKDNIYERNELVNFFDFLTKYTKKIIIIKGNHDNFIINNTKNRKEVELKEYYIFSKYCFLHGDRDFKEIYDKKIKFWIMGHLHPSIKFFEIGKRESYKCFIYGKYRDKKIIVIPSFVESGEGVDILEGESNLAWKFDFNNFNIKVIGDKLKVFDFGKIKKIKR